MRAVSLGPVGQLVAGGVLVRDYHIENPHKPHPAAAPLTEHLHPRGRQYEGVFDPAVRARHRHKTRVHQFSPGWPAMAIESFLPGVQ